jgi:hypothetical protein
MERTLQRLSPKGAKNEEDSMFARPLCTLLVASGFLAAAATAPTAHAHTYRHRHRHHGYSGYPYGHFAYVPGFYPSLGFGLGHYPFSVGLAFPGRPRAVGGELKTLVLPRDTEVFIDGYYAGIADDFDGTRELVLDPGPHVVTLYREDHRLHEETIYSSVGSTVRLRHVMEPLDPGEPASPRPGSAAPSLPPPSPAPTTGASVSTSAAAAASVHGTLALRSEPGDVEVRIDAELWRFPAGSGQMRAHLPPGTYRLELKKEGYEDFAIEVEILSGETTALNVRMLPLP